VDVGGMLLCPSCEADAGQQIALEEARLVVSARRAVMLSSVLAMVLFLFTAMTSMLVMVQPDGNVLLGVETLFLLLFSSYMTWAGFWGWGPLYRALKTSLAQTGCIFLAPPTAWVLFLLVGGMVLFIAAECYGACGVAIARHRKAALIAHGQLPPQPF
jgi:hypothetical protein